MIVLKQTWEHAGKGKEKETVGVLLPARLRCWRSSARDIYETLTQMCRASSVGAKVLT